MSIDTFSREQGDFLKPQRLAVEEIIPDIKPEDGYKPEGKFNNFLSSYSKNYLSEIASKPEVKKFYSDFKDQIVVDLGCGDNLNGYAIAAATGAKAYIGVEPYNFKELEKSFNDLETGNAGVYLGLEGRNVPFALVNQDMFGFLKRLPPRSVSILFNGIDSAIIPRDNPKNNSYVQAVNLAVERVLHKDGAIIVGEDLKMISLSSGFEKISGKAFGPLSNLVKFKLKKI